MSTKETPPLKPTLRILRLVDVCEVTGISRALIYRLQAEGRFPRSVKITEFAVGWIEHEVQAWLAERIEISRSRPARAGARKPARRARPKRGR